jgi:hypothetical protein
MTQSLLPNSGFTKKYLEIHFIIFPFTAVIPDQPLVLDRP